MLIDTNLIKAAMLCASTEKTRYYLNGVYFDPRGFIVATDGHRLFCAKIEAWDGDSFLIPNDMLKRAMTGNKALIVEVTATSIDGVAYVPIDGTFPDWTRVIPQELSGETAQFNPAYVADLGKVAKILGDKSGHISIRHNGNGPAGILFGRKDCFAVLMPVRDRDGNEWADAVALMKKGI
jgi:DNA polymerase-3 subunit beta